MTINLSANAAPPQRLTPRSGRASDRIVQEIEERIVNGELPDAAPLPPERDLMAQFGASRTVVREAILSLSNRGLIECKPRHRPVVRKPDFRTLLDATGEVMRHLLDDAPGVKNLYESRIFLERALVREAALRARKDDISTLENALLANREAINDSDAFYQTDMRFHGVLYRIPNNPIYPTLHQGYTGWLAPHWNKMLRSPERNTVNYRAHQDIFDAIRERDPDLAEQALENHLRAAWEYVRGTFG